MPGILDNLGQLNQMGALDPTRQPLQINPFAATPGLGGILGGGALNPGRFARAGSQVSGLNVHPEIPNQGSIESSISNSRVLPGVREVPFSAFEDSGPPKFYSQTEQTRTQNLADAISNNGYIKPLIIAEEARNPSAGPYVVEGSHRFDALKMLGKKSFPALVVHDLGE